MKSVPLPAREGRTKPGDFLVFHTKSRHWASFCVDYSDNTVITHGGRFSDGEFLPRRTGEDKVKCKCLAFNPEKVPEKLLALAELEEDLPYEGEITIEEEGLRISMEFLMGSVAADLYFEALEDDLDWFLTIGTIDKSAHTALLGE